MSALNWARLNNGVDMLAAVSEARFSEEWTRSQDVIQSETRQILRDHGASENLLNYVLEMKGYPRVPYFSSAWIGNEKERAHHGICYCLHAVGVKLLDDVIDEDQDVPNADLALGHVLIQHALARLPMDDGAGQFALQAWQKIWSYVVQEPRITIDGTEDWFRGAETKAGGMMEFYARLGARTARSLQAPEEQAARAMNLVGVIYMVGDDIRDWHALGERDSNLFAMIEDDQAERKAVRERLGRIREELQQILIHYPPAFDISPEVNRIARKWQDVL
ncbi:hypothetical protein WNZ15_25955 [Roseibium sp. AS2]|uniref:hypothetical protein n=1 Tax=Roseibium sp. AS2 TaxID=3135781 RepID=UPI003170F07F